MNKSSDLAGFILQWDNAASTFSGAVTTFQRWQWDTFIRRSSVFTVPTASCYSQCSNVRKGCLCVFSCNLAKNQRLPSWMNTTHKPCVNQKKTTEIWI